MKESISLSQSDSQQHKIARPSLPWTVRLPVSIVSTLIDNVCRPNGTSNRRLINFLDYQTPPKPANSVSSTDISLDATRDLWFRLYSPSINQLLPVLIFFHGGGFSFLSPASLPYAMLCRKFAFNLPAIVISVNYRLAPEHRYPSQYQDGFDVLKFLDENSATVLPKNADLSRCFFAGDSAGANLAHHVAVGACRTELRTMKVIGLISIQPFFGGEERTEAEFQLGGPSLLVSVPRTDWCWKAFLPEGSNRDHGAANVSGPNAEDISGLDFPKTMVVVGGFDPLKDWQRRYYTWLRKSGIEASLVEHPNMIHGFYVFPHLAEASLLVLQIKDFIAKCTSKVPNSKPGTFAAPIQVSP
ncbi:PREDICTED: probable carboxylesterase 18 [Theobroma cacao]|uniref:Carboxyesterase 18, putative n=2 Tax=Theobroma cacao TaxID=3641 RepID=A0A061DL27_THECC|nr:PREDICTED: probable carboxylesterase 18 [Theobroma cacao]EOX92766.1 Carboxyesterase 18, putative [Theobroma cacao]